MRTKDEWKQILEETLPPKEEHVARNRAITAYYAKWYLQKPDLLKWAGMASFASFQVGVGLALAAMLAAPDMMITTAQPDKEENILDLALKLPGLALNVFFSIPVALHDAATRELLRNDLDLIKLGNDEIFNDIGWAHLAYIEEGLDAIKANASEHEREYMLRGFQIIDEGAKMLDDPEKRAAGEKQIFEGNISLLRQEQLQTLPPIFARVTMLGRVFSSVGSMLDFASAGFGSGGRVSSFSFHFGNLTVIAGMRSITNAEDRWEWIEQDMLPAWKQVEASFAEGSGLHRRLVAMANQEPAPLHQVADLMNTLYPVLGMKANPFAPVRA